MLPTNSTLIPLCSSRLPFRKRILTWLKENDKQDIQLFDRQCRVESSFIITLPLTVSPSRYTGYVSVRSLSTLMSTCLRWSASAKVISTSTGVERPRRLWTKIENEHGVADVEACGVKATYSHGHVGDGKREALDISPAKSVSGHEMALKRVCERERKSRVSRIRSDHAVFFYSFAQSMGIRV